MKSYKIALKKLTLLQKRVYIVFYDHHCDDIETKWVLTPLNEKADKALITEQIHLMG